MKHSHAVTAALIALSIVGTGCPDQQQTSGIKARIINVTPSVKTDPVGTDPDDPAIWIHPTEPEKSLILATDKTAAPRGGLYVFALDGKVRQIVRGLDRPNNVDVEYGLDGDGQAMDIAVVTERYQRRLRIFAIAPDGSGVTEISSGDGLPVFEGEQGEAAAPMGIGLYRRPSDGTVFAIVSRKTGPREGYLWQYRLEGDGQGRVTGTKVRAFGAFSGSGEIEAVAVDDALGFVYYADEFAGIHKWHADPDHPDAAKELALFGTQGFKADREGIAIWTRPDSSGYIVCTDQLDDNSEYRVFRREGTSANRHDHSELVAVLRGRADSTDGIELTSTPLGPRFPNGLLVAMNSRPRNFLIFAFPQL